MKQTGGRTVRRLWPAALVLALGLIALFLARPSLRFFSKSRAGAGGDDIRLTDATRAWGLVRYSPTFGAVVTDIDNDGDDDLLVSNHSRPPSLFINQGDSFVERSDLLAEHVPSDWHGIAAVDLDNDGDRDFVCAGGGNDGLGSGNINRLLRNEVVETGGLAFEGLTRRAGITYRAWRTRAFLPLPSPDGSRVDLYMVGLPRAGCPNIYFANRGAKGRFSLQVDPALGLNRIIGSEGLDFFFDYDRDGDPDLLILEQFHPTVYERRPDGYHRMPGLVPDVGPVYCAAPGDLNNDGYPDLFLGVHPPFVGSDNFSFDAHELQFVVERQAGDKSDSLRFEASGSEVEIDFEQHTPDNPIAGVKSIFIGPRKSHPPDRTAVVKAAQAEGRPVLDGPGTYVWKEPGGDTWHVEWLYGRNPGPFKGRILASSLRGVEAAGFEVRPPFRAHDLVLINQQGRRFVPLASLRLAQDTRTRAAAMVDLDNDGRLDIIGLRGSEQGRPNGEPFVLYNRGGYRFYLRTVMANPEDDLFQADELVVGFFNSDGWPDVFFTNGYGLNPGNLGPYKLFLNQTRNSNDFLILRLRGTSANRDALGAEVELRAADGKLLGYRQVGEGYNRRQSTLAVHFGLGRGAPEDLKVRILWPGASAWDERRVTKNRVNEIVQ
jgi:hypothetical protein